MVAIKLPSLVITCSQAELVAPKFGGGGGCQLTCENESSEEFGGGGGGRI